MSYEGMLGDTVNDQQFRALIRGPYYNAGSLSAIDATVTEAIEYTRPVCVPVDECKRLLAIHWLRQARPKTFFARLRWAWGIFKAIQPWRS